MLVHCLAEQCSSLVCFQVVLHRLSWQKVWSVPPPAEDVKVKSLAWRPDGKGENMKFIAEMKVFILIIFVEIFFYTLYTLLQLLQLDTAMEKSTCTT